MSEGGAMSKQEIGMLCAELRKHPRQYAIELNIQHPVRGSVVLNTEHRPTPAGKTWERYDRCPTCEEWSPCQSREAIIARLDELAAMEAG